MECTRGGTPGKSDCRSSSSASERLNLSRLQILPNWGQCRSTHSPGMEAFLEAGERSSCFLRPPWKRAPNKGSSDIKSVDSQDVTARSNLSMRKPLIPIPTGVRLRSTFAYGASSIFPLLSPICILWGWEVYRCSRGVEGEQSKNNAVRLSAVRSLKWHKKKSKDGRIVVKRSIRVHTPAHQRGKGLRIIPSSFAFSFFLSIPSFHPFTFFVVPAQYGDRIHFLFPTPPGSQFLRSSILFHPPFSLLGGEKKKNTLRFVTPQFL